MLETSSIVLTTNAINFGMDELHDSSTQDSILFVHWCVWLNYLSVLVTGVPWSLYSYDFWYFNYVDAFRIVGLSEGTATNRDLVVPGKLDNSVHQFARIDSTTRFYQEPLSSATNHTQRDNKEE